MNIDKIYRLNNEYRALTSKAKAIRADMGDVSSREEGLCYQHAAQRASELASMTIGAENEHWVASLQMCNQKMARIWSELHPEDRSAAPAPEKKDTPAPVPGKAADPEKKPPQKGKNNQDIPDETVARWFQDPPDHGFDDVVGMEDVKEMLRSCIKNVTMDDLNDYLGISTVHSFFFYGPPGCGKTYTIEAFAKELMDQGYKFMKLESADIHSKFSGEADKIVKRAFAEAVDNEPCILFMDEIDGICQSRAMPNLSDFNMSLTTTFLTSYNNLTRANKKKQSVIFIGATNYPANVDVAMLDRVEMVKIPLPGDELRAHTFRRKFGDVIRLADDLSWEAMSEATEGYNQRDVDRIIGNLKTLIRNTATRQYPDAAAAVAALKNGELSLTRAMFDQAMKMYSPSPKDDVERKLNEFEDRVRTL